MPRRSPWTSKPCRHEGWHIEGSIENIRILWYQKGKLIWVFPKIRENPPQIIHFNRVWNHYFHHPFWGFYPLFLETSIWLNLWLFFSGWTGCLCCSCSHVVWMPSNDAHTSWDRKILRCWGIWARNPWPQFQEIWNQFRESKKSMAWPKFESKSFFKTNAWQVARFDCKIDNLTIEHCWVIE